jgi:hypothetical protein
MTTTYTIGSCYNVYKLWSASPAGDILVCQNQFNPYAVGILLSVNHTLSIRGHGVGTLYPKIFFHELRAVKKFSYTVSRFICPVNSYVRPEVQFDLSCLHFVLPHYFVVSFFTLMDIRAKAEASSF